VVVLVILRLSLGCHFLYEGTWKVTHPREFTAEPFLTQAKGPTAPLFYGMLPDLDGRKRLNIDTVKITDEKGREKDGLQSAVYVAAWSDQVEQAKRRYKLSDDQVENAEKVLAGYKNVLSDYLTERQAEINAYLKGLDLLDDDRKVRGDDTPTRRQRLWERQETFRAKAKGWLTDLDRWAPRCRPTCGTCWTRTNARRRDGSAPTSTRCAGPVWSRSISW